MKTLLLLTVTTVLAACGTTPLPPEPTIPPVKTRVNIPASTLQPCPALPHLDTTKALSQVELLKQSKPWFDAYTLCTERQKSLSGIVQRAFNIDKEGNATAK